MHTVGDQEYVLRATLGQVGHVLVDVPEGHHEVGVAPERVQQVQPGDGAPDILLGSQDLGDLDLGSIGEGYQVEGIAEAHVLLNRLRQHEVDDLIVVLEHALRRIEQDDQVDAILGLRGSRGQRDGQDERYPDTF